MFTCRGLSEIVELRDETNVFNGFHPKMITWYITYYSKIDELD